MRVKRGEPDETYEVHRLFFVSRGHPPGAFDATEKPFNHVPVLVSAAVKPLFGEVV
jgi:hypothetical protein